MIKAKNEKSRKHVQQIILKFKEFVPQTDVYCQKTQSWHRNPYGPNKTKLFIIKRCLLQSQRLCKSQLCLCRYQLLTLFTTEECWLEIFQFFVFLVVGFHRIKMRSLESVCRALIFSKILTKSLKYYWQQAPLQTKAWVFLMQCCKRLWYIF